MRTCRRRIKHDPADECPECEDLSFVVTNLATGSRKFYGLEVDIPTRFMLDPGESMIEIKAPLDRCRVVYGHSSDRGYYIDSSGRPILAHWRRIGETGEDRRHPLLLDAYYSFAAILVL